MDRLKSAYSSGVFCFAFLLLFPFLLSDMKIVETNARKRGNREWTIHSHRQHRGQSTKTIKKGGKVKQKQK
jgi:hypothetical protein